MTPPAYSRPSLLIAGCTPSMAENLQRKQDLALPPQLTVNLVFFPSMAENLQRRQDLALHPQLTVNLTVLKLGESHLWQKIYKEGKIWHYPLSLL